MPEAKLLLHLLLAEVIQEELGPWKSCPRPQ